MRRTIRRKSKPKRPLTRRQLQCVVLVARGKSARQIAQVLGISARTVQEHIAIAKKHTGVRTTMQLVIQLLAARQLKLRQLAK